LDICGLTIQPKIKPFQSSSYAVSETGFFLKKQLIKVNPLFKTNILKFTSGHILFCDQKCVEGALSISDYNYDVLWHNLNMARLF